jgi:hypothetical protein
MFRRILLAITFIAALGAAGLATPNTADAWRWGRGYYAGYGGYYYGPRVYGGYVVPYRTYYPGGYVVRRSYVPRYYAPYYGPSYYGGPGYYYGSPRVAYRIGW